ncbi:hypothetical protein IW139_000125 [Coemansia sp. RSA 353]|nr:hypothetical protein GGH17_001709 [Coemansia sp. RSA 788]KAJ2142984.1 hypothetical protein IW142_003983 [Coemansia sp. RSA 564]KAJ2168965.1 hypothetical protein GGH15_000925 [Coemansia sp. RSA 562]KAJ2187970.1 hypothetical protein EV181_002468 [Coemansia sp. RSA 532]KAJ2196816.1 hypothetical protein IW144_002731 [Coemansia sp. RSA 522]KAJ2203083.1 hypothetical protein IW145_004292 [Coemansia sp. RSA 521]KAJ2227870.1 hypothetical protein EV180_002266 [Coemansia sp. RSA 518]KAJ2274741.1 hyp
MSYNGRGKTHGGKPARSGGQVSRTGLKEGELPFYKQAANILARLERREGSIKNLTIGNDDIKDEDKRTIYALICQTLKFAPVLTRVLDANKVMKKEKLGRRAELLMANDMLLSSQGLRRKDADPKMNKAMSRHESSLKRELNRIRQEVRARNDEDLVPLHLRDGASTFRYVRVNNLVSNMDKVLEHFYKEGYEIVTPSRDELHDVLQVRARKLMRDLDLDDVLVFPPGTDLHAHRLFVTGAIILQDKASCMPAHVVQPTRGSTALDACAAPGNKTSHMVSMMGNEGKVFAFDMDRFRLNTLVKLTDKAQCKIIEAKCANFLELDPLDPEYASVEFALLDPSCSGSGIVNRMDVLVDSYIALSQDADQVAKPETDKARLASLAEFQTSIVLHAMRFPNIKRISYSTCSVHEEENEAVVARVLAAQSEFALAPRDQVIPSWPRRGLESSGLTEEQAACVVRTLPEDGTNGFFVAGFVRQTPADLNRIREELKALASTDKSAMLPPKDDAEAEAAPDMDAPYRGNKRKAAGGAKPVKKEKKHDKKPKPASAVVPSTKSKGKKQPKRKESVADA